MAELTVWHADTILVMHEFNILHSIIKYSKFIQVTQHFKLLNC